MGPRLATSRSAPRSVLIRPVDHPSFGTEIDGFLAELQREPRYFGPSGSKNPKPFPSLVAKLRERGGFHVAAFDQDRIVGVARVDGAGELFVAIVADRRGAGIGTDLCAAALSRARELHYRRVVVRTSQRGQAVRSMCERFGCVVVDGELGRVDLIIEPAATDLARTA